MYIISHRCNELTQVKQAYEYDGFECDVQLTKDEVPVLFHDKEVAPSIAVADLTYDALCAQLARPVTRVAQICEWMMDHTFHKDWNIFWELKSDHPLLAKRLVETINHYWQPVTVQQCFISFFPEHLRQLREIGSQLLLGINVKDGLQLAEAVDFTNQYSVTRPEQLVEVPTNLQDIGIQCVSVQVDLVHQASPLLFELLSVPLVCWTVNDVKQAKDIEGFCQYLITDVPEKMQDIVKSA